MNDVRDIPINGGRREADHDPQGLRALDDATPCLTKKDAGRFAIAYAEFSKALDKKDRNETRVWARQLLEMQRELRVDLHPEHLLVYWAESDYLMRKD